MNKYIFDIVDLIIKMIPILCLVLAVKYWFMPKEVSDE